MKKGKSPTKSTYDAIMDEYKNDTSLIEEKVNEERQLYLIKQNLLLKGKIIYSLLQKIKKLAFANWYKTKNSINSTVQSNKHKKLN